MPRSDFIEYGITNWQLNVCDDSRYVLSFLELGRQHQWELTLLFMKGYDHEQWMTNEEIGLFTFYKQRDPSRKAEKMQLSRSRRGLPHFIRTGEK